MLQLQSVCRYIFTINCSIYTPNNLNFIFHSNHSVCFFRHFYVLLAIRLLMLLWTELYVTTITVSYNSQTLLQVDVLFLALETVDKADVNTSLAAMKDDGHGVITVPHVVILSTGRGLWWTWGTGRFSPGKKAPLFVGFVARGRGAKGLVWRPWKRERFLSPTEIYSKTARLSIHYPSYYTNWAIHSNTCQFISWLSQMFISCCLQ